IREEDPPAPPNFYLKSKYCGEVLATAYRPYMRVIALRYFFVFGEGQRELLVPRLIRAILDRTAIPLAGPSGIRVTPTYVETAAGATEAALEAEIDGVVNVAGSEVWTIRDMCECLASAVNIPARFTPNTLECEGNLIADNARMTTLLGAHHYPIDQALGAVGLDFMARRQTWPAE